MSHSFSRTMPMPKKVDASMKNWMCEIEGEHESCVGGNSLDSVACHHVRSAKSACDGTLLICEELKKFHEAAKTEICGR